MFFIKSFFIIIITISTIFATENINYPKQFQGIIQQQNDYSCGTATVAKLIQGLYRTKITEKEVVDIILKDKNETIVKEIKEKGYSLLNLQNGSTSLGYKAMWRKIAPQHLPMIKQPVVILIGLKSEFPHFVVLKGVRDGEAYLADPIRGNVRVNYEKLIEEGISKKYPSWYVMGTQTPSENWRKNSILALSKDKDVRYKRHITDAQANIRNMLSLSKKEQLSFSIDYTRDISKSNLQGLELKEVRDNYKFGATYGITDNSEIGASFDTSKSTISNNFSSQKIKTDWSQGYNLGFTYRDKFDNSNTMGAIYGLNGSYLKDYELFNSSLSATVYKNIDGVSLIGGGAINKSFSNDTAIESELEDYSIGLNLGIIKPFANRYSASLIGSYQFDVGKQENSSDIYTLRSSLSWIYDKHIQVQPNLGMSFNDDYSQPNYSFGINLLYLGGW
ncbi:MAG: Bacteriocin resistance protein, putative [uncultured Sulfurovum sp.]|uniref:Bacteriocin resistance protein, putative n=1 Tax=uncultured Sulfurovum sp. TaxID=269237 RepID=A0A6S6SX42_9BACT|nr:MAG: Bacteriocin resistance protein, putative [uncultured Sulfurovum sp.]